MGEHLHHPGQHRPTHPRCVLRPRPHRHPPSIQGSCLGWLKQDELSVEYHVIRAQAETCYGESK